jgi:hypothetical protein
MRNAASSCLVDLVPVMPTFLAGRANASVLKERAFEKEVDTKVRWHQVLPLGEKCVVNAQQSGAPRSHAR